MVKISPFQLQIILRRALENKNLGGQIRKKAEELNKWVSIAWDEPTKEILFIDELPF